MASPLAARRIQILTSGVVLPGGELAALDRSRLRLHALGRSGEVRIPILVEAGAATLLRAAASELALLLATQHRRLLPIDDLERIRAAGGYVPLPSVAPSLGPSGGGPDLKAAARLGVGVHPALTGGIVCAWMGPGGRGRSLTGLVIEVLRRAFAEGQRSSEREETPVLVALALFPALAAAEEPVRALLPAPPLEGWFRAAVLSGLYVACATGVARALREAAIGPADESALALEAVLSPGALLGLRPAALAGATLYGCEVLPPSPRAYELAARLAAGADPAAELRELTRALLAGGEPLGRAEAQAAQAALRELVLEGVTRAEAERRGGEVAAIRELYAAPGGLASACSSNAARGALTRRLLAAADEGGEAGPALERAGRAVEAWSPGNAAAAVGLTREEGVSAYAESVLAHACDTALERRLARARRAPLAPPAALDESSARAEWEAGRLYRISAEGGPLLKTAGAPPGAHLYLDLKDVLRRAGLLGKDRGDLLQDGLFLPLVRAVRGLEGSAPRRGGRSGIEVNALGATISLSGNVEALLALAGAVPPILASFEERLAAAVPEDVVGLQLSGVAAKFEGELSRARAAREARRAARPGTGESARAGALEARAAAREAELERERDLALARARGERLEAGLLVSFGPPPLLLGLAGEERGAHPIRLGDELEVSIAGSARSPVARARADAALAAERARTGRPRLEHAWRVFVASPLAIAVPPALELAAVEAASAGDARGALRALVGPVRDAVERAARGELGAPEVLNAGAALTEEALTAYLGAVQGSRTFRRITLPLAEIPEDLRARWYYGVEPLELVAAFRTDGDSVELFRRAGRVPVEGRGEVELWELAAPVGGAAALAARLGERWLGGG